MGRTYFKVLSVGSWYELLSYSVRAGKLDSFLVSLWGEIKNSCSRNVKTISVWNSQLRENCTWAFHWVVEYRWLDVYMCLNTIAFYTYSSHPVSFSVDLFFCLKIKLIAEWFHITILTVEVCISACSFVWILFSTISMRWMKNQVLNLLKLLFNAIFNQILRGMNIAGA